MVQKRALQIPKDALMDDIHPQSKTVTVRIGFYKVGRLQFISHLDLQRAMKRMFLRSKLPIWFSEGFNPHPKMVFSTPLSIGVESECEFADVKFTAPVTPEEVITRFNACSTDELQLFYASPPVHKMTEVAWAAYEYTLHAPDLTKETAEALKCLYTNPLVITKKSKSGDKEVDISPFIRDLALECVTDETGESVILLRASLCADNANFLNPEYLMRAAESRGILSFADPLTSWYRILRTDLLLADGVTPFI